MLLVHLAEWTLVILICLIVLAQVLCLVLLGLIVLHISLLGFGACFCVCYVLPVTRRGIICALVC